MAVIERQRALGLALAGYLVATIVVITLMPFSFAWPDHFRLMGFATVADLVQNVVLFVPLGFFVAFAGGRALVWGGVLSLGVEIAQEFIPGRFPSVLDLATNGLGAVIGGGAYRALASMMSRSGRELGVRALDLPLMGTVYLLVPLIWLGGISAQYDPTRHGLALLPLLAGVVVFAAVDRHHFRVRGVSPWVAPVAAAAWAAVAVVAAWFRTPALLVGAPVGVALATATLSPLVGAVEPAGRRYEIPTVRRVLLPLGVFIALAASWPLGDLNLEWRGSTGWVGGAAGMGQGDLLQILELMAAATVAGFAIAEARGRAVESSARTRWVLLLTGLGLALAVETIRGFHAGHGANLLEAGLVATSTVFGGALYRRQRAYVVALLGRWSRPEAAPGQGRIAPAVPALGAP